jgi:hypothetical protein
LRPMAGGGIPQSSVGETREGGGPSSDRAPTGFEAGNDESPPDAGLSLSPGDALTKAFL